ncbi:hypothetical protein BCU41_025885 [Vibrio lentus]|uniref:hypothetical protein n=1 Tax=Vibrio lentus TaxID=136468 RepID=UPI0039A64A45
MPTTLDCWKYQVNHQCTRDNTCNALPTDCTTTATHCSAKTKKAYASRKSLAKILPREALQRHPLNLWRRKVFVSTVIARHAGALQ